MKTVRNGVFETNSSSTHSLCIKPENWNKYGTDCDYDLPYIDIKVEDYLNKGYNVRTAIITPSNYYKRGYGYFLIEGELQKIQFLISRMQPESSVYFTHLTEKQIPKFKVIFETIRKYLQEKYQTDYIRILPGDSYNDGYFIYNLIGSFWEEEEKYTTKEIKLIINKVIEDDSIVFICHSDESGPFPEDLGLIEVENFKTLIYEDYKE